MVNVFAVALSSSACRNHFAACLVAAGAVQYLLWFAVIVGVFPLVVPLLHFVSPFCFSYVRSEPIPNRPSSTVISESISKSTGGGKW